MQFIQIIGFFVCKSNCNLMKKIFTFSFLLIFSCGFSQDFVSVYFAQTYAKFNFKDQYGNDTVKLKSVAGSAYGVNYKRIYDKGFFVSGEFGYKNYSVASDFSNLNLGWSLDYLDLSVGGGYIYKKTKIQPYVGASLYDAYLYKAFQTIGSQSFDITANNVFKTNDIGINGFAGIIHSFSEIASLFFQVGYSKGLTNMETNPKQTTTNSALSFRFGMSFVIEKNKNKYNFMFKDQPSF